MLNSLTGLGKWLFVVPFVAWFEAGVVVGPRRTFDFAFGSQASSSTALGLGWHCWVLGTAFWPCCSTHDRQRCVFGAVQREVAEFGTFGAAQPFASTFSPLDPYFPGKPRVVAAFDSSD